MAFALRVLTPAILSSLTLTQGFLTFAPSYYSNTEDLVCSTFPYCQIDTMTGEWVSSLGNMDTKYKDTRQTQARGRDKYMDTKDMDTQETEGRATGDTQCWFEDHYCSPTDKNTIGPVRNDTETVTQCQAVCRDTQGCKYFTFLRHRTQVRCHMLSDCSLTFEPRCPNEDNCASGNPDCMCPMLERKPADPTLTYARWECDALESSMALDPYQSDIPVWTSCHTSCDGWPGQVSVEVHSTCLPGGEWSNSMAHYGRSFAWAKPGEGDVQCGCKDIGTFKMDPNTEEGAKFVCEGWAEDKYTRPFNLTSRDRCDLFCDEAKLESFHCTDREWFGHPELGLWCYTNLTEALPDMFV